MMVVSGCRVHEWPEPDESTRYCIRLTFSTDMQIWENRYLSPKRAPEASQVVESTAITTQETSVQTEGCMRYIIRAFPDRKKGRSVAAETPVAEYIFERNIADGYDCIVPMDLPDGTYCLMVWADMVPHAGDTAYYNADDFNYITYRERYVGDTDYRDAFCGTTQVSLRGGIMEKAPDTIQIDMQRPLGKFEFVATDVQEFLRRKAGIENNAPGVSGQTPAMPALTLDENDYYVMFYYLDYMPITYSMFSDKPIDSMQGLSFRARMHVLNGNEVSLGFDYVMMPDKMTEAEASRMQVQVGVYELDGTQVSLTLPIPVSLLRNTHTILRGDFLMQDAKSGLLVNPGFDGEWNIEI